MRIVELCPFSQGICGVWTRVKSESLEFIKNGHEVLVLSSDIEKGTGKRVELREEIQEGIRIKRFPTTNSWFDKKLSENVMYWFNKESLEAIHSFNPDVIITHLLHPHSAKIGHLIPEFRIRNKNVKIFVVPHAPFNVKRRFPLNIATAVWRAPTNRLWKRFDKVIAITHWEYPYLLQLGVPEKSIAYIPNGLPDAFFTKKTDKKKPSGVLFLGRIAPVKNLELLIDAAKRVPEITFSVVGASEPQYEIKLKEMAAQVPNIRFYPAVYNLKDKIKLFDNYSVFVLPSHREAMPQVLLEAMARGLTVVSSSTDGGVELIENGKTGLIFENGNVSQLVSQLTKSLQDKDMRKKGKEAAKFYQWKLLIKRYEELFK